MGPRNLCKTIEILKAAYNYEEQCCDYDFRLISMVLVMSSHRLKRPHCVIEETTDILALSVTYHLYRVCWSMNGFEAQLYDLARVVDELTYPSRLLFEMTSK